MMSDADSFTNDAGWENWREFLHQPDANGVAFDDPYAVDSTAFQGIMAPKPLPAQEKFEVRMDVFLAALEEHPWVNQVLSLSGQTQPTFLLDCHLPNGRNQPVQVQFLFDPLATALDERERSMVRLVSPLGPRDQLSDYLEEPVGTFSTIGVRLGYDAQREPRSLWALQAISELPVVDSAFTRMARSELFSFLEHFVQSADEWELRATNGAGDLQANEVSEGSHVHQVKVRDPFPEGEMKAYPTDWSRLDSLIWKAIPVKIPSNSSLKKLAITHMSHPFVQLLKRDGHWQIAVSHPLEDADSDELKVLEWHLAQAAQRWQVAFQPER